MQPQMSQRRLHNVAVFVALFATALALGGTGSVANTPIRHGRAQVPAIYVFKSLVPKKAP
jgi:hypothetical protein